MRSSTLYILTFATFFIWLPFNSLIAQEDNAFDELEQLSAELDALLADEEDSLSLMGLIDSLLAYDQSSSFMSVRLGYSSRVTSAGRTFGVDQQGLTPGISYYHKTGLFADVTGLWNSDLDPQYFATIFTGGYLGTINKKWSYIGSYDYTLFNTNNEYDTYSLTNSLTTGVTLDLGKMFTSLNYSFSFGGGETSNQVIWSISGRWKKKGFKPFKNVTFMPGLSVLMGNQNLLLEYYDVNREERLLNLSEDQLSQLADRNDWTDRQRRRADRLLNVINSPDRTPLQDAFLQEYFTTQEEVNYFGVLNYYLTFPVSLTTNKLGILVSYNYNIPRELTGSEYTSESTGYFGFTLSYNIGL